MIEILRQAIIEYSDMGFQVVPCMMTVGAFGKKRLDFGGFRWKRDLTGRMSIRALTRNDCNALALKTGPDSGLTVVDADSAGAVSLVRRIVPDWIPSAKTPGGRHWYFSYDSEIHGTRHADLKLDVKNDNGLAIAPPTEYAKGAYRWVVPIEGECPQMPDALRDMLLALQATKRKRNKAMPTATNANAFNELSERQQSFICSLVDNCRRAALGDRSGRDFYLCVFSAKAGLSPEALFELCGNVGKFKERGRGYFDFTYRNAKRAAGK
ncbi:MAG: hypothetical protein GF418_14605 [Chitinivibrionales bacterium]|nr:hypothetical protein [Chitinivibrionales bacterium]MBD3396851.1 hypothetical protein [Chitinivibrionales bacterium]